MKGLERVLWLLVALWAIGAAWPASFWYDAGAFRMPDYVSGADRVEVAYAGGPRRDFKGSYVVLVRNASDNGVVIEDASGVFPYRKGAGRPEPLTIDWWAAREGEAIRNLPPGDYALETCWTVRALAWAAVIPPKTTCHDPALFHVFADGDGK